MGLPLTAFNAREWLIRRPCMRSVVWVHITSCDRLLRVRRDVTDLGGNVQSRNVANGLSAETFLNETGFIVGSAAAGPYCPPSLGSCGALSHPAWLGPYRRRRWVAVVLCLAHVALGDNSTGNVSSVLGSLPTQTLYYLLVNQLSGTLPKSLSVVTADFNLLNNNIVSGTIPHGFCALSWSVLRTHARTAVV
eukprot:INCI1375.1.p1 GENE.INCI1375.1~~INCI1375.1.p1  ORF type:complete len:192 (-),score=17.48 INCI1375.1:1297-1872(-)